MVREQKTMNKETCKHDWVAIDANENGGYARILAKCRNCERTEWFEEKDAKDFPVWWQEEERAARAKTSKKDP